MQALFGMVVDHMSLQIRAADSRDMLRVLTLIVLRPPLSLLEVLVLDLMDHYVHAPEGEDLVF